MDMSRRVWTGVLAGLLAASVLLAMAGAAYRAGQHHEVVSRTVGDGGVVRVVDGAGWGHGPGPGFFLLPLLGITLLVVLVWGRRGGRYGWHGQYGPPWAHGGPESAFEDWHRRAHSEAGASTTTGSTSDDR
jgi:hypothetical protein